MKVHQQLVWRFDFAQEGEGLRGAAHRAESRRGPQSTQLGITLASLGLGWVGKPVFASLLAPVLKYFNVDPAQADWLAFAVGFTIITFLHIVVGELAPKSLRGDGRGLHCVGVVDSAVGAVSASRRCDGIWRVGIACGRVGRNTSGTNETDSPDANCRDRIRRNDHGNQTPRRCPA